jgi:hypothetical protein
MTDAFTNKAATKVSGPTTEGPPVVASAVGTAVAAALGLAVFGI